MIWGVRIFKAYRVFFHGRNLCVIQWLVCAPFLMCIALSLAELSSAAPTSGGLYYWTFKMTSERRRCFLSWIVGCK